MKLYEQLESRLVDKDGCNVISITGGGGKTTLLVKFGDYLRRQGYSVLITTTTKVQSPTYYRYGADSVFVDEVSALSHVPSPGTLVFYAERNFAEAKKSVSPRAEVLSALIRRYDVTLVEADGSRGMPLKMHTSRDPVILPETTAFIAVMGVDGIGRKAYEVVFGSNCEDTVDRDYLEYYFGNEEGLLKKIVPDLPAVVIFNRADEFAFDSSVLDFPHDISVLVASEEKDEVYEIL